MPNSICTLVRKHIGQGKTQHLGRGFYVMDTELTPDQVIAAIKKQLPKWQEKGLVEKMEETPDYFHVKIVQSYCQYYNRLYVNKKEDYFNVAVYM